MAFVVAAVVVSEPRVSSGLLQREVSVLVVSTYGLAQKPSSSMYPYHPRPAPAPGAGQPCLPFEEISTGSPRSLCDTIQGSSCPPSVQG